MFFTVWFVAFFVWGFFFSDKPPMNASLCLQDSLCEWIRHLERLDYVVGLMQYSNERSELEKAGLKKNSYAGIKSYAPFEDTARSKRC